MKERNILAGFPSDGAATQAKQALQQAGFDTVQVDFIEQYPNDGVENYMNPITGDFPALGSLSLSGNFPTGRDASVLAAASPEASGMADRDLDNMDKPYLLTAVVPENRYDEATQIIRSLGGMI